MARLLSNTIPRWKNRINLFEIVFLGTSASAPSIHRGLTSQVVIRDEHRFLIDCGEGTQRQIMRSGIGFKRLNKILITHGHLDHILGLGGLLSTFMRWEAIQDLEIIAGAWALERIKDLLFGVVLRGVHPPMDILLREITPGEIFNFEDFRVSAFPVLHRGSDCYGFRFEEKPRRPFLPERAEQLSIPPGPWRRKLVGGKSVTLPDGRLIQPDQVLGPQRDGTRFVHVGDVGQTGDLETICRDADTLVIEATYLQDQLDLAHEFAHFTARQAAELALGTGVKNLILTHVSRRYREKDIISEAQAVFPSTHVARDFDHYVIKRGQLQKSNLLEDGK